MAAVLVSDDGTTLPQYATVSFMWPIWCSTFSLTMKPTGWPSDTGASAGTATELMFRMPENASTGGGGGGAEPAQPPSVKTTRHDTTNALILGPLVAGQPIVGVHGAVVAPAGLRRARVIRRRRAARRRATPIGAADRARVLRPRPRSAALRAGDPTRPAGRHARRRRVQEGAAHHRAELKADPDGVAVQGGD